MLTKYKAILLYGICCAFALLSCVAPIKKFTPFYPGVFYSDENIYENKSLGFTLVFKGNWVLLVDPGEMDSAMYRMASEIHNAGQEMLFAGSTVEGYHGARAIANNLNEPSLDYARAIRELNKKEIVNDEGLQEFIAGKNSMVKWLYEKQGFRFVEFFFTIGTYDIRIAFWTRISMFERFLPVYEEIISSLELTYGF